MRRPEFNTGDQHDLHSVENRVTPLWSLLLRPYWSKRHVVKYHCEAGRESCIAEKATKKNSFDLE